MKYYLIWRVKNEADAENWVLPHFSNHYPEAKYQELVNQNKHPFIFCVNNAGHILHLNCPVIMKGKAHETMAHRLH